MVNPSVFIPVTGFVGEIKDKGTVTFKVSGHVLTFAGVVMISQKQQRT